MNLQELLQKQASMVDRQEEIVKGAMGETRGLSEEEQKEFDGLQGKIEGVKASINAVKKLEANRKEVAEPVAAPAVHIDTVKETEKDNCGFKNFGEFAYALRFGDEKGRLKAMSMDAPATGGVMVPPQFRDELLELKGESSIVRNLATVLPAGSPPDALLTIPVLDQGANGVNAGVTVSWIGEGAEKPATQGKFKTIDLQPQEVAAHTEVTDTLLRNWASCSPVITRLLTQAVIAAEDIAFLKGDGVKKPLGIFNATGAIKVDRATATQISHIDILTMLSKLSMGEIGNYKWIAHQTTLPSIMSMKDEAGNLLYNAGDVTKGIQPTLLGMPISFTAKTNILGAEGDLLLADLSKYLIKDGSGPYLAASEHVHFTSNRTVFKIFELVDGKPWVETPLTMEDGVTQVSPYVILK